MELDIQISDKRVEMATIAAKEAGMQAYKLQNEATAETKQDGSTVTTADRNAETLIRDILESHFETPILGEEETRTQEIADTYWVVDPIDGTENYSRGQPLYSTSVGLIEDGEPTIGAVYVPETDHLFYGKTNHGAYINNKKLTTKYNNETKPYLSMDGHGTTDAHDSLTDISKWIQHPHSAVYGLVSVAAGWVDCMVVGGLAPWDVGASIVLIQEAGGTIYPLQQDNDILHGGFIATTSDTLHDTVINALTQDDIESLSQGK